MDAERFLKSIYLGDRGAKALLVDFCNGELKVQVDCISRVRGDVWNFYNDENLDDGFIVFERVHRFYLEPDGMLPNDFIVALRVRPSRIPECRYLFELKVGRGDAGGYKEMTLGVYCDDVALESRSGNEGRIRT